MFCTTHLIIIFCLALHVLPSFASRVAYAVIVAMSMRITLRSSMLWFDVKLIIWLCDLIEDSFIRYYVTVRNLKICKICWWYCNLHMTCNVLQNLSSKFIINSIYYLSLPPRDNFYFASYIACLWRIWFVKWAFKIWKNSYSFVVNYY